MKFRKKQEIDYVEYKIYCNEENNPPNTFDRELNATLYIKRSGTINGSDWIIIDLRPFIDVFMPYSKYSNLTDVEHLNQFFTNVVENQITEKDYKYLNQITYPEIAYFFYYLIMKETNNG